MPAGVPICALRASGHRTSGKGFTGWPTPNTPSGGPNTKSTAKHTGGIDPDGAAQLAGWCSPTAQDHSRGDKPPRPWDTGVPLSQQAVLAGWATPDANAMNDGEGLESWNKRQAKNKAKHGNGNGAGMPLAIQCKLAGWATPTVPRKNDSDASALRWNPNKKQDDPTMQILGRTSSLSDVPTEKRGALNAALPRWLQGYPVEWCIAALLASRKRKPRQKRE